ncbi:MAG: hypothetical protein A3H52_00325 [Candidatus Zambryskibacteria bacterium RIFCSPLOWO2_02_FULL_39_26]|uniref:HTH arsR-type domain-containing protein n=1 Tax=Candidatus Zambryskibacteria bacterium RIFCSPLOWO2_12_FULL_39_23 TaxID=1802776 RepID=A0A1G2US16_9BACT|nr:MAG: hypothetical protein A2W51_00710 [Candidatus Zambryskibacteria bacterium RIFCSPHIGHO2_02_39_10]OHB09797.1 MAG: hypothetical protein A3H52_00325 [Candidatus Zambryskibacteria bacterium RIFCSPLOWO2_02_FULL_39_26]OHB12169.1 MAG: hypothetical protein A3G99_00855 [Candidatus Zambryskibacteria bacterium RIFCSPLOWO2_12_FULL_39_23]
METLSKLFGSENKVKIMRLFLFNPDMAFDARNIAFRIKARTSKVRREISVLRKTGLIRRKGGGQRKKNGGFILNKDFSYLVPLQNFLINTEPLQSKEIMRRISKLGSIKLIIVAGVFIQEPESRADLLIVGDNIKKGRLQNTIKTLESEIGKELKYAHFTTEDFKYRLSMFDKLIRDILDYPHRKVLNKLGIV